MCCADVRKMVIKTLLIAHFLHKSACGDDGRPPTRPFPLTDNVSNVLFLSFLKISLLRIRILLADPTGARPGWSYAIVRVLSGMPNLSLSHLCCVRTSTTLPSVVDVRTSPSPVPDPQGCGQKRSKTKAIPWVIVLAKSDNRTASGKHIANYASVLFYFSSFLLFDRRCLFMLFKH